MKTLSLSLALLPMMLACPVTHGQTPGPIRIRVFPTVTTGTDDETAVAMTRPLIDNILAPRLRMGPMDFDIARGEANRSNLLEFGRKLNEGDVDFGVVWGIEFGWLRQQYP